MVRDGETQHVRVAGNALLVGVGDVCPRFGFVVLRSFEPPLKLRFHLPLAGLQWIYVLVLFHAECVIGARAEHGLQIEGFWQRR